MATERDTRFDVCQCGHAEFDHSVYTAWPDVTCSGFFGDGCSCRRWRLDYEADEPFAEAPRAASPSSDTEAGT
jgi:hypothetical protein